LRIAEIGRNDETEAKTAEEENKRHSRAEQRTLLMPVAPD
jgi:hypothetical protein